MGYEFILSSMGGCGSTFLHDYISQNSPIAKNINPNRFPPDKNCYKHRICPTDESQIKKSIFIYSDPVDAYLSLWKRDIVKCHLYNLGIENNVVFTSSENEFIGRVDIDALLEFGDIYRFTEMFDCWLETKVSYPILFLKYEEIWNNLEELFEFVEIPSENIPKFPKKKQRTSSRTELNKYQIASLKKIYEPLNEKINTMKGAEII